MPTIEGDFEVWCNCGRRLCNSTTVDSSGRRGPSLTIEPCERCLEKAKAEGYEEGREKGYEEGDADGWERGCRDNIQTGEG